MCRGGLGLWIRSEERSEPLDSKQRGGPQRDITHGEVWTARSNEREVHAEGFQEREVLGKKSMTGGPTGVRKGQSNPREVLSAKKKCQGGSNELRRIEGT